MNEDVESVGRLAGQCWDHVSCGAAAGYNRRYSDAVDAPLVSLIQLIVVAAFCGKWLQVGCSSTAVVTAVRWRLQQCGPRRNRAAFISLLRALRASFMCLESVGCSLSSVGVFTGCTVAAL